MTKINSNERIRVMINFLAVSVITTNMAATQKKIEEALAHVREAEKRRMSVANPSMVSPENNSLQSPQRTAARIAPSGEWSKEDTLYFIDLYKQYPCLWDVTHIHYKDRDARVLARDAILEKMNKRVINIDADYFKIKISSLRSQFRREMRKLIASKKSDAESKGVYVPKFWCFNSLRFLTESDVICESVSSIDTEYDSETIQDNASQEPETPFQITNVKTIQENASQELETPFQSTNMTPRIIPSGEWSKEDTLYFIDLYKQYPCLWHIKNVHYKDRDAKVFAMNAILEKMSKRIFNINVDCLKNKMLSLRSQFRRDLRQLKASKKSGAGSKGVYVPKFWCFDSLYFLTESRGSVIRESISSIDTEDESETIEDNASQELETPFQSTKVEDDETDSMSPTPSVSLTSSPPTPTTGGRPARKKKRITEEDTLLKADLQKINSNPNDVKLDEDSDYAKVVGNELRKMSDLQKKIAKKVISEVLFMGSMDMLTPTAQVTKAHHI